MPETKGTVQVEIMGSRRHDNDRYPYIIEVRRGAVVIFQAKAKNRRAARRRARKLFDAFTFSEVLCDA